MLFKQTSTATCLYVEACLQQRFYQQMYALLSIQTIQKCQTSATHHLLEMVFKSRSTLVPVAKLVVTMPMQSLSLKCATFLMRMTFVWQIGELGKVDQGGGGTIAYILANAGAEVVDCGTPMLSMHAPL